ncbi:6209_t:CDS:2 [Funneliformis geosporum]|uniref:6209_t:CDS:1 n=1 Tax=Funneliformis geosporum TaxID=1117311 RepID=A0A9W4SJ91_9GLOM|nr:6209_t:CDS:2 [Funneliformis geosporum]
MRENLLLKEKEKEVVGQPSCNLFKISDFATWNDGYAGTSRHHSEDNDIPEIVNQLTLARRYRVINIVGEGAFSKTVCAEDIYRNRSLVAIKIMISKYNRVGFEECKKLRYLNLHDVYGNSHISKLLNTFFFDKHFCLVFEYYRGGVPKISYMVNEQLRLQIIRKIACQFLIALIYIKHMAVIHGDLKLENILFVTENSHNLRIIDFGNAIGLDDVKYYMESFEIQSLLYRAPEVLLGLPFGYEIDMWSFGCIICEIWIGCPIFQSDTKIGIIKEMEQLNAKNFAWYSTRIDNGLKDWPTGSNENTLQSIRIRKLSKTLNTNDMDFIKFIDEISNYNSSKRLTPTEALCHRFFAPLFPFGLFYTNHAIDSLLKTSMR